MSILSGWWSTPFYAFSLQLLNRDARVLGVFSSVRAGPLYRRPRNFSTSTAGRGNAALTPRPRPVFGERVPGSGLENLAQVLAVGEAGFVGNGFQWQLAVDQ